MLTLLFWGVLDLFSFYTTTSLLNGNSRSSKLVNAFAQHLVLDKLRKLKMHARW